MSSRSTARVARGVLAAAVLLATTGITFLAGNAAAPATVPSGCTGTSTISCQYTSAGESVFVVPAGITSLHVVALGAPGASSLGGVGGRGASVSADVGVTPGDTVYAEVGVGAGARAGSGANGGGAADLRTCSVSASCGALGSGADPRLIVAGGGGGGGAAGGGGSGGAAGFALAAAACNPGASGGAGSTRNTTNNGGGAGGASCTVGGTAGLGANGGANGSAGSAGLGGTGASGGQGGGGGGGGYFGGGGGGTNGSGVGNAGGGGGGSSFVASAATNIAVASNGAASSVTISYSAPIAAPDAPTGLTATARDASADLSFIAPADNGSAITSYEYSTDATNWHALTASGSSAVTATVAPLANGTTFSVQVRAVNAVGAGAPSTAATVTPLPAAGAPSGLVALAGNTSATLSFTAPGSDGGSPVTGYEYSLDATTWHPLTTSGSAPITAAVNGLTNGTTYSIRVRAVTAIGGGAASTPASVTPATVPVAPSGLVATAGNSSAVLSFTAPSDDGGAAVTGYQYSTDATTWHILTTSGAGPITATAGGLTNGTTYSIQVRAVNAAGAGAASVAASVTPVSVPGAPGSLAAMPGNGSVGLSFTAPTDDGGSVIVGYEYSTDSLTWASLTISGTGPITASVDGLANGTRYSIEVRAVTSIGAGAPSAAVSVTPVEPPPAAPAAPLAVAGVSSVTISWTASTSAGVTGYTVIADPGPATCSTESPAQTSCVVGAVAGQSYTYVVIAHGAAGDSTASPASAAVTALAPPVASAAPLSAPTTLTTTGGAISHATPGQHVTAVGTGFAAYSSVTITAYSTPIAVATVTTSATGRFSVPVIIPVQLEAGAHNLVASGANPSGTRRTIRLPFTVALAASVPLTTSTPEPTAPLTVASSVDLAATGAPAAQLIPIGIVLLIAGGSLAVVTRRRSPRPRLEDR